MLGSLDDEALGLLVGDIVGIQTGVEERRVAEDPGGSGGAGFALARGRAIEIAFHVLRDPSFPAGAGLGEGLYQLQELLSSQPPFRKQCWSLQLCHDLLIEGDLIRHSWILLELLDELRKFPPRLTNGDGVLHGSPVLFQWSI